MSKDFCCDSCLCSFSLYCCLLGLQEQNLLGKALDDRNNDV